MDEPPPIPEQPPGPDGVAQRRGEFLELKVARVSDRLQDLEIEIAGLRRDASRRPDRVTLLLGGILSLLLPVIGTGVWWQWLDPIAPAIVPEYSEIHERRDTGETGGRRIFEVIRIITSERDAPCTIHAYFQRADGGETLTYEGRPVVRDSTMYEIAVAQTYVEKGTHQRDRLWEVPGGLPPGEWIYRSHFRFCNPLRCEDVHLPPMKVVMR